MPGTLHQLSAYIKPGVLSREASLVPAFRRDAVTHDRPHVIKGKVVSAEIVKRVDFTPEHFKIWLRCADPFPFEPGQYCTVGVAGVERPYSIVSSPREPLLELFVELIPPPLGHLTPLLHATKVGDTVTLRPRGKGVFLLRPEFRNHVMVATVTGVAPFVSMVRHWLEDPRDDRRMFVLEGASFGDEFGYDDELRAVAARNPSVVSSRRARGPTIRAMRSGKAKSGACTRSSSVMSESGSSSLPQPVFTRAAIPA